VVVVAKCVVITAATKNNLVLLIVTLCISEIARCFARICHFYFQGESVSEIKTTQQAATGESTVEQDFFKQTLRR
jgi:hypothetical protein